MSASRQWEHDGFEDRSREARRTYRRAEIRARRRADFWSDVGRYALIVALLLFFMRPIGLLVGIIWGCTLWSRYSRLELEPRLRRRWTERELARAPRAHYRARQRRRRSPRDDYAVEPPSDAEQLLEHIGDSTSQTNLEKAREALASVEQLSRTSEGVTSARDGASKSAHSEDRPRPNGRGRPNGRAPRSAQVRMSEVLEDAIDRQRARMRRSGVALHAEFDTHGELLADAGELRRVFSGLIASALDQLERDGTPSPQIELHMGENLARTQVWVRIRHNGPGPDADALDALLGPGMELETNADEDCVLTFDKRGRVDVDPRADRPSGHA